MTRRAIDWAGLSAIATGMMGWPPERFWQATPTEFWQAWRGWARWRGIDPAGGDAPLDSAGLDDLRRRFGDL